MSYLLYATHQAALNRSAKEAKRLNMGETTQYATAPRKTKKGKWALPVQGYDLTEHEQGKVVETVQFPEPDDG